ncbi:ATP-binding protein [Paenibacillus silvisoli]|uniref:ATP-binding protein n=1 Tax=Paenibacillus silvisoli TaxID=3110539 RepID=UPI0028047359|nr:ATP-binding protein [Paenibacillus silvisoli]
MKSVRQLLNDLQQKRFVGREREIALMTQELGNGEAAWRLHHFHGPGGIGKSALLRAFERMLQKEEIVIYVDVRTFEHPARFADALRDELERRYPFPHAPVDLLAPFGTAEAERMNRLADIQGRLVLLLDGIERGSPIANWLRDHWLPQLITRIKVFTAGRFPLNEEWISAAGWIGMIRNVRLSPLSKCETDRYTAIIGIDDPSLRESVKLFSGGIPLALSLACESILQHGAQSFLAGTQTTTIIAMMDRALFQDGQQPAMYKRLLSAASMIWWFDQDLLEEMLGETIMRSEMSEFCSLPYVMPFGPGGYSILDGVRRWMNDELSRRAPDTHQHYKLRALRTIERRWRMLEVVHSEEKKRMLRLQKLYLVSDSFMQSNHFASDGDGFVVRQAIESELPAVIAIYERSMTTMPPFLPDDTGQQAYIHAIWKQDPGAIRVVLHGGLPVGFYAFVRLSAEVRNILADNRVLSSYFEQSNCEFESSPNENEYMFWLLGSVQEYDPDVLGLLVREIYSERLSGRLVFTTIPLDGPIDSICRLGFERLPWADYRSPGGLHYKAARIDLRGDDFFHRIPALEIETGSSESEHEQRMPVAAKKPQPQPLPQTQMQTPAADRIQLAKQLLEHHHRLLREPALLGQISGMLPPPSSSLPKDQLAARISVVLATSLMSLAESKPHEQLQERILRLFYLERIGSHEMVAQRLGMPMTTYYRHLKKGIRQLADLVFDQLST